MDNSNQIGYELFRIAERFNRSVTYAGKMMTLNAFSTALQAFKQSADHPTLLWSSDMASFLLETYVTKSSIPAIEFLPAPISVMAARELTYFCHISRGGTPETPFLAVIEMWLRYCKTKRSITEIATLMIDKTAYDDRWMLALQLLYSMLQPKYVLVADTENPWFCSKEQAIRERERDWIERLFKHFDVQSVG